MSVDLLATFEAGGSTWAINVLQVREILQHFEIAPVPQAPTVVTGLMNLRGQIVTALDLASCLGVEAKGPPQTCIVLKSDAELVRVMASHPQLEMTGPDPVGLLVERMGDVIEVDRSAVDAVPSNTDEGLRSFLGGVIRLDGKLLLLLKLAPVLQC